MFDPGAVITYRDMCSTEELSLQRGMNFKPRGGISILLMSRRPGAPYKDQIESDGTVLIYEGHDEPKSKKTPNPKVVAQRLSDDLGRLNQNGRFFEAVQRFKSGDTAPELAKVYEKIRSGIWVFNGHFRLIDAWQTSDGTRKVNKFKLEVLPTAQSGSPTNVTDNAHPRMIPPEVKVAVWKRDQGKCVVCGSTTQLHFDHVIPYSRGGSSVSVANIQLLCARHNLQKHANIQ